MGRWTLMVSVAVVAVAVLAPQPISAQPEPAAAPTLQRLSQETQAIYEHVRPGIVRVQLPPTYWPQQQQAQAQPGENPLEKWKEKLDPDVRKKIDEAQAQSSWNTVDGGGAPFKVNAQIAPAGATTQPATTQPHTLVAPLPPPPRLQVAPRMDGGLELLAFSSSAAPYDAEIPNIELKVIGILIDDAGHVLVPLYIEHGAIADQPLRISTGDGKIGRARFVGSDRQTNLTVLKLIEPVGGPVRITPERPNDGALVMVLSPAGDAGRLSVWTGGQQDRGIVVSMDGAVAGFARYGQFLAGAHAQPVVEQLVRHGRVRRATLGVLVGETETPDGRRAMRIERVMPETPAEQVGLRAGDFILSMGSAPVSDLPSFAAAIAARDGETDLQILRGDKRFTVTVMLKQK